MKHGHRVGDRKVLHSTQFVSLMLAQHDIYGGGAGKIDSRNWMYATRNPKRDTFNVKPALAAVVVVPVIKTEGAHGTVFSTVLVKQFRPAIGTMELSFPAGLVPPVTAATDQARVELMEETGLTIDKFVWCSSEHCTSAGLTDEMSKMYIVDASGTPTTTYQEVGEDIDLVILPIHTPFINPGPTLLEQIQRVANPTGTVVSSCAELGCALLDQHVAAVSAKATLERAKAVLLRDERVLERIGYAADDTFDMESTLARIDQTITLCKGLW